MGWQLPTQFLLNAEGSKTSPLKFSAVAPAPSIGLAVAMLSTLNPLDVLLAEPTLPSSLHIEHVAPERNVSKAEGY